MVDPIVSDRDGLLDIAESLIGSWYAGESSGSGRTFGQRDQRPDVVRFVSVVGFAGHVHHLIAAALDPIRQGNELIFTPLLRLAYESTLTATWMALNNESTLALHNKEIRARGSLLRTASQTKQFAERVAEFPALDEKISEVSSDDQARKFYRLCADLAPDGQTIYLLYRILSKKSHPSGFVVDHFVSMNSDGTVKAIALKPTRSQQNDPDIMLFIAVMCLVYAGRAVDFIEPSHPRRSELRRAARSIGIPPELSLTPEAHQRIRVSAQKRRRSRRKYQSNEK